MNMEFASLQAFPLALILLVQVFFSLSGNLPWPIFFASREREICKTNPRHSVSARNQISDICDFNSYSPLPSSKDKRENNSPFFHVGLLRKGKKVYLRAADQNMYKRPIKNAFLTRALLLGRKLLLFVHSSSSSQERTLW